MHFFFMLLLVFSTLAFSVEAECGGKSQFAVDNEQTFKCYYDPSNNIAGFFYQSGDFKIIYYNENKGVFCRHGGYTGSCSTFYECLIADSDGNYSYICKTKKNANVIKERLKRAK